MREDSDSKLEYIDAQYTEKHFLPKGMERSISNLMLFIKIMKPINIYLL